MSENQLYELVQNVWTPEKEYDFPLSTKEKKAKKIPVQLAGSLPIANLFPISGWMFLPSMPTLWIKIRS